MSYLSSKMKVKERNFVQAIRRDPFNMLRRHDYAKWLRQRGEYDQANLIKVQLELVNYRWDNKRRPALEQRERLLLSAAMDAISAVTGPAKAKVKFTLGQPESLTVTPDTDLGDRLTTVCRELPLSDLSVIGACDLGAIVSAVEPTETIWWSLDLSRTDRPADHCETGHNGPAVFRGLINLAECSHFDEVKWLLTRGYYFGPSQAKVLARVPWLGKLEHLSIHDAGLTGTGLDHIVSRIKNTKLMMLGVENNPIGDEGAEVLARHAENLFIEHLYLSNTGLGPKGARLLARANGFTNLAFVSVTRNRVGKSARLLRKRFTLVAADDVE
jgi:uncharacterized protein (TIGR02996 family)